MLRIFCKLLALLAVVMLSHADETNLETTSRFARLGDGCHHVFLDLGANIGVHARFLFERKHYPKAQYHSIFDMWFGADRRLVCVFAFEPNPQHYARHHALERHFGSRGLVYHMFPFAVAETNGTMKMYPNARRETLFTGNPSQGVGFSMVNRESNREGAESKYNFDGTQEVLTLQTIDITEFVDHHVIGRRLPIKVDQDKPPAVVVKMDVEGAEFDILDAMVDRDVLCRDRGVSMLTLEWHTKDKFLPISTKRFGVIRTAHQAEEERSRIQQRLSTLRDRSNCSFQYTMLDDESYAYDQVPIL